MASMRDIKARISNIQSTEQIIRAMDTIASSKLIKARAQLDGVRPMYETMQKQVTELGEDPHVRDHAYYEKRDVKSSLYIVMTSDQGFAGAYNSNVVRAAMDHIEDGQKNEKLLTVGYKGHEYFRNRGKQIIRNVTDFADSQVYYVSDELSKWATELYMSGEVDEVFIVYTYFENIMSYIPHVEKMLPLTPTIVATPSKTEWIHDPDLHTILDHGIPLHLHMTFFRAFSESHTSEQAARMINMDTAGKNANDLIEELTKQYNRERQAAITQELSEIVGGQNQ